MPRRVLRSGELGRRAMSPTRLYARDLASAAAAWRQKYRDTTLNLVLLNVLACLYGDRGAPGRAQRSR